LIHGCERQSPEKVGNSQLGVPGAVPSTGSGSAQTSNTFGFQVTQVLVALAVLAALAALLVLLVLLVLVVLRVLLVLLVLLVY